MKGIYLLIFLLIYQTYSFCQTNNQNNLYIEGIVISGINKKPLEGVPVHIKNSTLGSITNNVGYFKISGLSSGEHHIEFRYIGYMDSDTIVNVTSKPIEKIIVVLKAECFYNRSQAENDIARGAPKLLLVGSITPVVYVKQHKFEKKYQVQYYDFGDTPPAMECIEEYNQKIFKYLDNKFGRRWRKEVRSDVISFKK